MKKERVLCIKRHNLPNEWVTRRSVIRMELDQFVQTCSTADYNFYSREKVETDPSYKQVIPYIVLQTKDLQKTAIYRRAGSEKRLHDLWSVGIGGHINPEDNDGGQRPFEKILISGMERELDEELILKPENNHPEFIGLINEEITDVGSVHIGAVFKVLTNHPGQYEPGEELVDFSWIETSTLGNLNLELWSELAIELL